MRKIMFAVLAAVCLALPASGQDPSETRGPGAPSAQSPVPDCLQYKRYRDTLTGDFYTSYGFPCAWIKQGGGGAISAGSLGGTTSGNALLLYASPDSAYLSQALPASPGTNNVVFGSQAGSNIKSVGAGGSTWFGGNNTLMGRQAGKSLTSAADNTLFGYQAGQSLQGGFSTGCTAFASSEEDGIVTAFGENAAAALNTPTSGACEISSDFFGQKAAGVLGTSYNDTFVGTHSGTNGAGVSASTSSVVVGAWAAGGTASTTLTSDVFVGANAAGGGAGGTYAYDVGVGSSALATLDGTAANTADWNTAVGDFSGCSITSGRFNTFMGAEAGGWSGDCRTWHITGTYNIGIGYRSLNTQGASVSGGSNIVIGNQFSTNPVITSGSGNVIIGALGHNIGAASNIVAIGPSTNINANGTENHNVLVGDSTSTGAGNTNATAIGSSATVSGANSTAIGAGTNVSAAGSTAIGYQATNSTANTTVIGGTGNTVTTLTNKGAVNYLSSVGGSGLDIFGPNLSAGQYIYSAIGVAATNNNNISSVFRYVGAGSTSNWADWNFAGNSNNNITVMANGKNCVNHTTNDCNAEWDVNGAVLAKTYTTATNCSSSAAPAVCSAAPAGSVVIAAAGTTVTVNTTAVTANSQIFIQEDSSLGTKLSVTCNTTLGRTYAVTARTAGTSFVITASAAPTTNPACLSYSIVN